MKNGTQSELLSQRFKALADPNRLQILEMLRKPGCCAIDRGDGMCACDIEQKLDLSQPTISHHIKMLKACGLVAAREEGQFHVLSVNERTLSDFARSIGGPGNPRRRAKAGARA